MGGIVRGSALACWEIRSGNEINVLNRNAPLKIAETERLQRIILKVTLCRVELISGERKSDQKPMLS